MAPMPNFLQQAAQANTGGEWIKFDDNSRGVPVTLEITEPYRIRQYKYNKEVVRYMGGPNAGKPKYEMVINGNVNGEPMILATGAKYRLENAIAKAVQEAGASDLQIGGKLTVTYVRKEAVKGAGAAQVFEASYEPNPEGADAYNEALDQTVNPPAEDSAPQPTFTPGGGLTQGGGAPSGFPGGQQSGAPAGFPGAR